MNPFARIVIAVNLPHTHRFLTWTVTSRISHSSLPNLLNFTSPPKYSSNRNLRIKAFSVITNRILTEPISPVMNPASPSEPGRITGDDFIHIETPNKSNGELSESFVKVEDDPRKDDGDVLTSAIHPKETEFRVESSELRTLELPEELSRSVVVLTCDSVAEGGKCDVYLIGTAHVSQESCREVQEVISYIKPQVVFLELCSSRVNVLTPQNLKVPTFGEMVDMWKKKHNTFGILYSWFLAKVASKLDVFPGSEFRVAFEEAMKYGGKVILGDRPVQVTLLRTWGKMPLWHKTKLIYSLLFQAVFLPTPEDLNKMLKDMDDIDMLTLVIQEMSKEFPTLMDTLVHERDQYMSSSLLKVAREHGSVVAVVGKGHLQGIKKNWEQPVQLKDLLTIPPKNRALSTMAIVTSLGVAAAAGVAIVSGIMYVTSKK